MWIRYPQFAEGGGSGASAKNRGRRRVVKLTVSFFNEVLSKAINAQKNAG